MRRALSWVALLAAVVLFGLAGVALWASSRAYDEAGEWFRAAVYDSECADGKPSAGTPACDSLDSGQPAGAPVRITDPQLIRTVATSFSATGAALLTICGLLVSAASLMFAVFVFLWSGRSVRHGVP